MKKISLSLAILFSFSASFSQSFMHGVGLGVIGTSNSRTGSSFSYGEGFTYSPRFNFLETEMLSVSVGIPLSIGVTENSSTNLYGDYNTSVGVEFNVPVIVSLNMGRGSTKENRQKFGYFFGAGFGYHHGDFLTDGIYDPNTNTITDTYSSNIFGPAANAGVRIAVGRKHKNVEIRFSYMKGLNQTKPDILGLACLFNF